MTGQKSFNQASAIGSNIKSSGHLPASLFAGRFIAAIVVLLIIFPSPVHAKDAPDFVSEHGITVIRSAWLQGSNRTVIVDIETPLISNRAIKNGIHKVFITLPENYFAASKSAKRYPVLYLMHGMGGYSGKWAIAGGTAEWSTSGKDLITVMPDCGTVGWFTDWVDESDGAQHWETFHLTQLIPWIDANLRTNPRKNGRAIAGFSMGGYGAFHYAFRRPDLFAYAASFSGALDLQDAGTQLAIYERSIKDGFPGNGAFGPKSDDTWNVHNPLKHVESLRSVHLAIYAGSGINDLDAPEISMGNSANKLHKALDAVNIPNFFWMYGRPGGNTGCNGGHNFGCWNMALNDALPKMMAVLSGGKDADVQAAADVSPGKQKQPDGLSARDVRGPDIPANDKPVNVVWD
jgi:S-formylglutathione hydrolase FrmB